MLKLIAIKEVQIKTTLHQDDYNKKRQSINVKENVEKLESLLIQSGNVKWCSCRGRKFEFLKKIKQNFIQPRQRCR